MNLSETVVNRPITVVILFALLLALAGFLIPSIPVELFPSMEIPMVAVMTQYNGAGPEDVEENVTKILEQQLANVTDLKKISSISSEGFSQIALEFTYSKDLNEATTEIRDKLELASTYLPDDAESPVIYKLNTDSFPVMVLAIQGNLSQNMLRSIAQDKVQPFLERVNGVSVISLEGGQKEIVEVDISQNRLEAYNLTLSQVAGKLRSQNYQLGSGDIREGDTEYLIRTDAEFSSLDEIRNVVISYAGGGSDSPSKEILLKDLASVSRTNEKEENRVFVNGQYGVTLSIQKESNANSVAVAEEIRKELEIINKNLPDGVEIIVFTDDSKEVNSVMKQTYMSLLEGILLAMLVLFFFLRSWSSTIIIALSIPISILITILFMYFMGLTFNLMTLTGIILGLGMVVDNSIVIQENIFKFRERETKLKAAAVLGSREMVMSITASTLTTICVFLPLILFADKLDMMGQMIRPLSYTVIIALVVSLVVSLTFVPALSANFLKVYTRKQKPLSIKFLKRLDDAFSRGLIGLDSLYKKMLSSLMAHKGKTLFLVFAIFVLAMAQIPRMGIILAPEMSESSINISMTLPRGTTLDETESEMNQFVHLVEEIGGFESLMVTIGESGYFGGTIDSNKATIEITFPDAQHQIMSVAGMKVKLMSHFNDFPSAILEFNDGPPGLGNENPVDLIVQSDNLNKAMAFAEDLKTLIAQKLPAVYDLGTDMDEGLPQFEVVIDRARAYALGLDMVSVANEISASINGSLATTYRVDGDELEVKVILKEEDRNSVPDLNKFFVVNQSGERISLANIARLKKTTGPVSIKREDKSRTVHVLGNLMDGYASSEAQKDIQNLIDTEVVIPDGVTVSMGGDFEDMEALGLQLVIVMIIAIILVFGVMAAQFESLKDPFIIFFTIPLMLIGVILFYLLSSFTLSLMSALGLIVLTGLVVNGGIVLVDYINLMLKRGYGLKEACIEAAGNRFRPILMTTTTTILGMAPLAFFGGAGTEQVQPIAQTIIGGLFVSSLMTLFVTPILFAVMNKRKYA